MSNDGERLAKVGELELAYETFGDPADPAALMIMGVGSQMIQWPVGLCELLAARGYHVIRFDNRDCGHSTKLAQPAPPLGKVIRGEVSEVPYGLHEMAGDAVGLLEALAIERAHVVGASLGGMIAQRLAIDHPGRVLSLASIMSTTGAPGVGTPTEAATEVLMSRPATERQAYIDGAVAARKVLGSVDGLRDDDLVREVATRAFDRGIHPDGTARQLAAIIASPDRTPELRRIQAPTVVIHGSIDPLIGLSGGEATAAAIPGAQLVVIDGMGHDLPPGSWVQIVDALVANFARAAQPVV